MNDNFTDEFKKVIVNVKEKYSLPLTTEKVLYGILSIECKALDTIGMMEGINLIKILSDLHRVIISSNQSNNLNEEYAGNISLVLDAIHTEKGEIDSLSYLKQTFSIDCLGKIILERHGLSKAKIKYSCNNSQKKINKNEFYYDLTDLAFQLDEVIGREKELERCINILSRRLKNNPLLIGKPGVGKTALVEGLAIKISNDQVPKNLLNKKIVVLEIGKLVAGTKYRGEFEEKLYKFLQNIQEDRNTIVFIDEIHTIMGAGAVEGGMDAGNILKPALARGDIQFIGATTFEEYKLMQVDKALERRFQLINVSEPTIEEMREIAKKIKYTYEQYHKKIYSEHVLDYAIDMAERYIPNRYFPDKFIDIIDEAGVISSSINITVHDIDKVVNSLSGNLLAYQNPSNSSLGTHQYISDKFVPIIDEFKSLSNLINNINFRFKHSYTVLGSILFQGNCFPIINDLATELSQNNNLPILRIDFDLIDDEQLYLHLFDPIHGVITNWKQQNNISIVFFQNVKEGVTSKIINKIVSQGYILDPCGNNVDFSNTFIFTYCDNNSLDYMRNKFDEIFELESLSKDKYIEMLLTFVLNSMNKNFDISYDTFKKLKKIISEKIYHVPETPHLHLSRSVIDNFFKDFQNNDVKAISEVRS